MNRARAALERFQTLVPSWLKRRLEYSNVLGDGPATDSEAADDHATMDKGRAATYGAEAVLRHEMEQLFPRLYEIEQVRCSLLCECGGVRVARAKEAAPGEWPTTRCNLADGERRGSGDLAKSGQAHVELATTTNPALLKLPRISPARGPRIVNFIFGRNDMTSATTSTATQLSQMLNNAFTKFDRDGDDRLNSEEFSNFNEVLKPGLKLDDRGIPTVDMNAKMDPDGDGFIDRAEMGSTGVLMPANLTDSTLKSMLDYLHLQVDPAALQAAAILEEGSDNNS
ncbi:EF-hand domain-containing protein [Rhizobium leguminosarum]|uniref:EF-hand domain-containing protein n=2 Tax=Rhizobium leguminosarum TaxID=384 RepID=UPI001FEDF7F2|nr:EF-hand domain-containing protein [Rhizobium leguminosarum]